MRLCGRRAMTPEEKADLSRFNGPARDRVAAAVGCRVAQVGAPGRACCNPRLLLCSRRAALLFATPQQRLALCLTLGIIEHKWVQARLCVGLQAEAFKLGAVRVQVDDCIAKFLWMKELST